MDIGETIVFRKPIWEKKGIKEIKFVKTGERTIKGVVLKVPKAPGGMYTIQDNNGNKHRVKDKNMRYLLDGIVRKTEKQSNFMDKLFN